MQLAFIYFRFLLSFAILVLHFLSNQPHRGKQALHTLLGLNLFALVHFVGQLPQEEYLKSRPSFLHCRSLDSQPLRPCKLLVLTIQQGS